MDAMARAQQYLNSRMPTSVERRSKDSSLGGMAVKPTVQMGQSHWLEDNVERQTESLSHPKNLACCVSVAESRNLTTAVRKVVVHSMAKEGERKVC
jgi:uncharacterized protein YaaW (UPF0174 family)